jgi:hypothetical protein
MKKTPPVARIVAHGLEAVVSFFMLLIALLRSRVY